MGRFSRMTDGELVAIGTARAQFMGEEIARIYRDHAPRSPASQGMGGHTHFADSFSASAVPAGAGFEVRVDTSEPDIAGFIEFGHGDIYPVNAKALHWIDYATGTDVFTKHVGPLAGNPWQARAQPEVDALVAYEGSRIGVMVADMLGGK